MARFRVILEYDGTRFHGWQAHSNVRTVEGSIVQAVRCLAQGEVICEGASRTDTGVHARGQVALIVAETALEPPRFARALAALTPPEIGVVDCRAAAEDFHPRERVIEKRYLYRMLQRARPPVFGSNHLWWVREALDLEAMRTALAALIGTHDFASFRNFSKDGPESSVRTVRAASIERDGDELIFQVIGDGFLYKMVRNFTGTLVEVGRGRIAAGSVGEILAARDRRRAGPTAPPEGLFLMEVAYPDTPRCALASGAELAFRLH